MSIRESISPAEIKNIFSNQRNKEQYLRLLYDQMGQTVPASRTADQINNLIIESWDYERSKNIIRALFVNTDKYNHNRACGEKIGVLTNEWNDLGLGAFDWPFKPQSFDNYVHTLNRKDIPEDQKDQIISSDAIKFRRIKDLNAVRNDYIEYLIFENNENIIPTFTNAKGVDFYINGEPFDQKVSRSVSPSFRSAFGDNCRQMAIEHPEIVAKALYEDQDEERFGCEQRLFFVYLDENLSMRDIENSLRTVDFSNPLEIDFSYTHAHNNSQNYHTKCYVVLLYQ